MLIPSPGIVGNSLNGDAGAYLGVELEMPVADQISGASRPVTQYFAALAQQKYARQLAITPVTLRGKVVAIQTELADCGLDNGFNLLETALAPVASEAGGLLYLADRLHQELEDTLLALQTDQLTVLNVAQHPYASRNAQCYQWLCVPRPIYKELVDYRGWRHDVGIDAKAQNGANTAMPVNQLIAALNAGLAIVAPVSIALFANSPLEDGQRTPFLENRMTLWERTCAATRFPGDIKLHSYPKRPFTSLADYFMWMFGEGTVARSITLDSKDYKSATPYYLEGQPSLLAFLNASSWKAHHAITGAAVEVQPETRFFVEAQVEMLLDARIRYRLEHMPELATLVAAWSQPQGLERLFEDHGMCAYIEGRAAGANFADASLLRRAGPAVAASVLAAPSALQLGLYRQLEALEHLIKQWGWSALGQLRQRAVRYGIDDENVYRLCQQAVAIAKQGLAPQERGLLAYVDYVLERRQCGAHRLLHSWQTSPGASIAGRLAHIVEHHTALLPSTYLDA